MVHHDHIIGGAVGHGHIHGVGARRIGGEGRRSAAVLPEVGGAGQRGIEVHDGAWADGHIRPEVEDGQGVHDHRCGVTARAVVHAHIHLHHFARGTGVGRAGGSILP